jgi:hypothetical protein
LFQVFYPFGIAYKEEEFIEAKHGNDDSYAPQFKFHNMFFETTYKSCWQFEIGHGKQ